MKITKKLTAIFVAAFAALSLTACSSNSTPVPSVENIYQSSSSSTSTTTTTSSESSVTANQSATTSEEISSSTESPSEMPSETESSDIESRPENSNSVPESSVAEPEESTSEPVTEPQPEPAPSESGKVLVAYFSWSGTSERIANNIISNTGADFYRIERDTPYSDDYNTVAYGEAKDEADSNARPPLKNAIDSIDEYDTIVLCYPIWWHTCPMTVGTFLNKFDFSGKMVIPVSQSASMDIGQYEESVQFIKDNAANASVPDGVFSKDQSEIDNYLAQYGVE